MDNGCVAVDIFRVSPGTYIFTLPSTAEQLCVIDVLRQIPAELSIWNELWGRREGGGFRTPAGSSIDDLRTFKTVFVTEDGVETLRFLATRGVAR